MPSSTVSVLVVDDYEPFRRFVHSTLRKNPKVEIIGQASDGAEAVRQAEKLKPQLILLDIGLPTMNGIDAARQIRKLAPESKIIFVTQESSAETIQAAFKAGAMGYVLKSRACTDLMLAVEAVVSGKQFFGSDC
jgi:DNA-binding NarL/FixJ family response regulator